ncbi:MAG: DUF2917 domain-containing protein, partial [Burkholderiales bacterium]
FDLDQGTIKLTQGGLIRLREGMDSIVAVLWGKIWLTQDGDRRDYELGAEESCVIRTGGLTLISALEDSSITILQPCDDHENMRRKLAARIWSGTFPSPKARAASTRKTAILS